tara:strand:+ start:10122 stop:10739 length:618 start_codon:yes stop_codon:yes gene_type:complete
MRATVYFVVEVKDDYNNEVELSNGIKLAVNNSLDSVEHINRVGKLIDAPKDSNAKKGDMLIFHHNICRRSWGLRDKGSDSKVGKKRKSSFYIKEGIYYIPVTEIFMIKREGEADWEAIDPYVFVKPLEAKMRTLPNGFEVMEDSYKEMKNLVATISYPSKALQAAGVDKGDLVAFQEDSEFEFEIGGETHYRMVTNDILAVYERP